MEDVSGHGTIDGLWAIRDGGLRERVGNSADLTFRQFVLENRKLYDLQGSDAALPHDLDWLGQPEVTASPPVNGNAVERIRYRQNYRGNPVLDGDIIASFFGGRLISVTGRVINPAIDLIPAGPFVSEATALANAQTAVSKSQPSVGFALSRVDFGVLAAGGVAVYRFRADVAQSGSAVPAKFVYVSALDGTVTSIEDADPAGWDTSVNYRVYRPNAADATSTVANQVDLGGTGWNNGAFVVYPWKSGSQEGIYSFTSALQPGGQYSTYTQSSSSPNFLANPGTAQFRQQHAEYWAQLASGGGMYVLNSLPSSTVGKGVRVLVDVAGLTNDQFLASGGCNDTTPDEFDSHWCVRLGAGSGWQYADDTPALSAIFHEMGHFVDQKYTGTPGRRYDQSESQDGSAKCGTVAAEEGKSVSEAIAMAYAMNQFLWHFGTSTTYAAYNANPNALSAGGPGNAHNGDGDIRCYRQPNVTDDCTGTTLRYPYGDAFVQAVSESAWGRNCDTSCWIMNDGAGWWESTHALAYAMANTPMNGGFIQLSANYLTWYYYWVGQTQWSNRWWVFNHHRLVGDVYGYSPCDAW